MARAYRELERAGFVTKRSTTGTFVSAVGSPLARSEYLAVLGERIDALLAEARQMNVSVNTVRNYVRSVYDKLHVHSKSAAVNAALRQGLIR